MSEDVSPDLAGVIQRMHDLPDSEKLRIRRIISGEEEADLICKRDVYDIISDEVIASVSSFAKFEIQRALRNVRNAVSKKERFKGEPTAQVGDR